MAYNKTTWIDGQTKLNAENLNKIENGLESVSLDVDKIKQDLGDVPEGVSSILIGGNYASNTQRNFNTNDGAIKIVDILNNNTTKPIIDESCYRGCTYPNGATAADGTNFEVYQWFGNVGDTNSFLINQVRNHVSLQTGLFLTFEYYIYSKNQIWPLSSYDGNHYGVAISTHQQDDTVLSYFYKTTSEEVLNSYCKKVKVICDLTQLSAAKSIDYGFVATCILGTENTQGINQGDIIVTGLTAYFFNSLEEATNTNVVPDWQTFNSKFVTSSQVQQALDNTLNEAKDYTDEKVANINVETDYKLWNNKLANIRKLSKYFINCQFLSLENNLNNLFDYNEMRILAAGDSIMGRQDNNTNIQNPANYTDGHFTDAFTPEISFTMDGQSKAIETGHFPPNMWEQTVPYKILQMTQFKNADVQYFNYRASNVVRNGTWTSAFPAGADSIDLITTSNNGDSIECALPAGSKYCKYVYSVYGAGTTDVEFKVEFSDDNGSSYKSITELNITCNRQAESNGNYKQGNYKWGYLNFKGLDTTKTYKIRITKVSGTTMSVWGFESWSLPKIEVIVSAQGGTIAANHKDSMFGMLDIDYYEKPFVIYELPYFNDFGVGIVTQFKGFINSTTDSPTSTTTNDSYYCNVDGVLTNFNNLNVKKGQYVEYNGSSWKIGCSQINTALTNYYTNIQTALNNIVNATSILLLVPHTSPTFQQTKPYAENQALNMIKQIPSLMSLTKDVYAVLDVNYYQASNNLISENVLADGTHLNDAGVKMYEDCLKDVLSEDDFSNYLFTTNRPAGNS